MGTQDTLDVLVATNKRPDGTYFKWCARDRCDGAIDLPVHEGRPMLPSDAIVVNNRYILCSYKCLGLWAQVRARLEKSK